MTLLAASGILLTVAGLTWQVWKHGPQRHAVGGWGAPLGIDLYADGLTALMLMMTAMVGVVNSVYALGYFSSRTAVNSNQKAIHQHKDDFFWPLWLFLWAALNALFLSADIFNLYVTLELMALAAVALVTLEGQRAALTAGMRYLLTSLLASMVYLMGVALLYAAFNTLELQGLSERLLPSPLTWSAMALMTVGLLLKTAVFPLHFWLPPAHSNAPAPVSVLLSALVVKASFYLLLRLWFQVFPPVLTLEASQFLGVLGVAAILWGALLALRQQRLKMLLAYSTVAQIGYLFLLFPLTSQAKWGVTAWSGGLYHALCHACAKAAIVGFTRNAAIALGPEGISVNVLCPGNVHTPMNPNLGDPESKGHKFVKQSTSLKRVGDAMSIAPVIVFLCSPLASYITAADINISAGQVIY